MSGLKVEPGDVVVEELEPGAVERLRDREAWDLLGISGDEFAERWTAGDYANSDDPRITDLAMLLP